MKYSEAKKRIKALSSKYDVDMEKGYFNIIYNGFMEPVGVDKRKRYEFDIYNEKKFLKLPFNNKLYMIMAELAMTPLEERADEKKYFIHVFKGNTGYLNVNTSISKMRLDNSIEMPGLKTKFTHKEIEQLEKREGIPLDWKKVKLEPVNN